MFLSSSRTIFFRSTTKTSITAKSTTTKEGAQTGAAAVARLGSRTGGTACLNKSGADSAICSNSKGKWYFLLNLFILSLLEIILKNDKNNNQNDKNNNNNSSDNKVIINFLNPTYILKSNSSSGTSYCHKFALSLCFFTHFSFGKMFQFAFNTVLFDCSTYKVIRHSV